MMLVSSKPGILDPSPKGCPEPREFPEEEMANTRTALLAKGMIKATSRDSATAVSAS